MMSAELEDPWRRHRWCADEGEVVLVRTECRAAPAACAATAAWPTPARAAEQHVVTAHDFGDLPVARRAERGLEQRHHCHPLGRRQIAEPQPLAGENARRQVGPAGPLFAVERKLNLRASGVIERTQYLLRGSDDAGRRVGAGGGWRWRCAALSGKSGDDCNEYRNDDEPGSSRDTHRQPPVHQLYDRSTRGHELPTHGVVTPRALGLLAFGGQSLKPRAESLPAATTSRQGTTVAVRHREVHVEVRDGFIVGIFNYCDRWCETCAFT